MWTDISGIPLKIMKHNENKKKNSVCKDSCESCIHLNVVGYKNKIAKLLKIEKVFASVFFVWITKMILECLNYLKHWSKLPEELLLIQIQLKANLNCFSEKRMG